MTTLFHGGYGGLRVGMLVLPPDVTGASSSADFGAEGICRRDRVYLTTDELTARVWAALHPSHRGKVYEVQPLGELEVDPDCKVPGQSWAVRAARVVRVIQLSNTERRDIVAAMLDARSAG